jgi:hypothetical protein
MQTNTETPMFVHFMLFMHKCIKTEISQPMCHHTLVLLLPLDLTRGIVQLHRQDDTHSKNYNYYDSSFRIPGYVVKYAFPLTTGMKIKESQSHSGCS